MTNLYTEMARPVLIEFSEPPANMPSGKATIPTWSSLFKKHPSKPYSLLDLPAEIIDKILGYTCSNWAATIIQHPFLSLHQPGPLVITYHPQSVQYGGLGLIPLSETNRVLREHLRRCLHTPTSFSGYTQLVDVNMRSFRDLQYQDILLDRCIDASWPDSIPRQVLQWILSATKVLEVDWTTRLIQSTPLDVAKFFPNVERVIFMTGINATFSTSTVKEIRDTIVTQVRKVDWSNERWAERIRTLAASSVRLTLRVTAVHPSHWDGHGLVEPNRCVGERDFHPMILSMDIKGIPLLTDPPDIHIRTGSRDFHSPCCSTGRMNDWTIQYAYANLADSGLHFKYPMTGHGKPCDICRHWGLNWSGVNGDRLRFNHMDKRGKRI